MSRQNGAVRPVPHMESLRIRNYRVLRDVHLPDLLPLTILIGPNGTGKSTVIDVFAFLSECFAFGLPSAWNKRGGMSGIRSRDATGPVQFELRYKESRTGPALAYRIAIDERDGQPVVAREQLDWTVAPAQPPFPILHCENGCGSVAPGDVPCNDAERREQQLASPDLLAVNALGKLREHPRLAALRAYLNGWFMSGLDVAQIRQPAIGGPDSALSPDGSNLPNVVRHLQKSDPAGMAAVLDALAWRVPHVENVSVEVRPDGRNVLMIQEAGSDRPLPAEFISDGTLKMLAQLVMLRHPAPPPLITIEEPERLVQPALWRELGEDYLETTVRTQLFVASHAPSLIDSLAPEQVRVFARGEDGFAHVRAASEIAGILDHVELDGLLGTAWSQNLFSRPTIHADAR